MSFCFGSASDTPSSQNSSSAEQLQRDKEQWIGCVKLLLLGSSEGGKSTLARQMKVLRLKGFTEDEKEYYREHIQHNLAISFAMLGAELEKIDHDLMDKAADHFLRVQKWVEKHGKPPWSHICDDILQLINATLDDKSFESLILKHERRMKNLPDSSLYLFQNKDRICDQRFTPTADDIMRCRIATTGVHELRFEMQGYPIRLIDVGGQTGQRRKWITQFDGVHGMIFVTALSDYCRLMGEDGRTNRMEDSFLLFEDLVKNKCFAKASVLIFFNKKDVFKRLINTIKFSEYFPGYKGLNDYESVAAHIQEIFMSLKPRGKKVYTHFTNATDTENIKKVFKMTFDIILRENIGDFGLM